MGADGGWGGQIGVGGQSGGGGCREQLWVWGLNMGLRGAFMGLGSLGFPCRVPVGCGVSGGSRISLWGHEVRGSPYRVPIGFGDGEGVPALPMGS